MPLIQIIAEFLTIVFNRSFNVSTFSEDWKYGIITPINKIASPISAADYRPIIKIPFLSKVQEKIVYEQLVQYLEDNELLDIHAFAVAAPQLWNLIPTNITEIDSLALFKFQIRIWLSSNE